MFAVQGLGVILDQLTGSSMVYKNHTGLLVLNIGLHVPVLELLVYALILGMVRGRQA
jgi:hypothetical protein